MWRSTKIAARFKSVFLELSMSNQAAAPFPSSPESERLYQQGIDAFRRKEGEKALTVLGEALKAFPQNAQYLKLAAQVCESLNRWDQAAALWQEIVRLAPENALAWFSWARMQTQLGRNEQAVRCYRNALTCDAGFLPALVNLGDLLSSQGEDDEALELFQRAAELHPASIEAVNGLALLLQRNNRFNEAIVYYHKALALDAGKADVINNLGNCLCAAGKYDEAEATYRRAEALGDPYGTFYRALLLLTRGQWEAGLEADEQRFLEALIKPRPFAWPRWQGEPLAGKTLLIWGEQGVGDELMFASLLPDMLARNAKIILEMDARLAPMFTRSFPSAEIILRTEPASPALLARGDVDYQIPMGSLMRHARPARDYALRKGYLQADAALVAETAKRYRALGKELRVGISWVSKGTESSRQRSMKLTDWLPVLRTEGVRFFNLQYGDHTAELNALAAGEGITIHHDDQVDPLCDMEAFAAQVASMDLVISCANSTVHMAGSLGVPVWVLVPYFPSWRWFLDRDDSYWYRHIIVFRQNRPAQWEEVIALVADRLAKEKP